MSNWTKDSVLDYLRRVAPDSKLFDAWSLANDIESLKISDFYNRRMLAVLSALLLDKTGKIKPEYANQRPAIQQALKTVQNCQAWVVCGPVEDGMGKLMEEIEEGNKK
jgi:hypothetical protein